MSYKQDSLENKQDKQQKNEQKNQISEVEQEKLEKKKKKISLKQQQQLDNAESQIQQQINKFENEVSEIQQNIQQKKQNKSKSANVNKKKGEQQKNEQQNQIVEDLNFNDQQKKSNTLDFNYFFNNQLSLLEQKKFSEFVEKPEEIVPLQQIQQKKSKKNLNLFNEQDKQKQNILSKDYTLTQTELTTVLRKLRQNIQYQSETPQKNKLNDNLLYTITKRKEQDNKGNYHINFYKTNNEEEEAIHSIKINEKLEAKLTKKSNWKFRKGGHDQRIGFSYWRQGESLVGKLFSNLNGRMSTINKNATISLNDLNSNITKLSQ